MSDLEPPEIPIEITRGLTEPKVEEKKGFFAKLFSKKSKEVVDPNIPVINSINTDNISMPNMGPELDGLNSSSMPELPPLDNSNSSDDPFGSSNSQSGGILVAGLNDNLKNKNNSISDSSENNLVSSTISNNNSKSGKKSQIRSKSTIAQSKAHSKSSSKHKSGNGISKPLKPIDKFDESSQFDWTRDVKEQEILIHDNNRSNDDINIPDIESLDLKSLMEHSDNHIVSGISKAKDSSRFSEHEEVFPKLEPINLNLEKLNLTTNADLSSGVENSQDTLVSSTSTPSMDAEHTELFQKISTNHSKVKKKLAKIVNSKHPKKDDVKKVLNEYDESVEKHIENKEIELHHHKKNLEKLEKHLQNKEKELNDAHSLVKNAHTQVISRQQEINSIISETVEKELTRRLKIEKTKLREEIKNTSKLNSELKKKIKLTEDDKVKSLKSLEDQRVKNSKEYERTLEIERRKLNDLQAVYERKLNQLSSDQKKLESEKAILDLKRKDTLDLIKRGEEASKELTHLRQVKEYMDKNKSKVEKELSQDKELKIALEKTEKSIADERKNLDNLIFSKYIENKLKGIRPDSLSESQDLRAEANQHPLYADIEKCKNLLKSDNLADAKSLYTQIRQSYDSASIARKEKEGLYVALRELYNEIQLKIVETQMRTK